MPGAPRSTAPLSLENPVGLSSGPIARDGDHVRRLAGNSSGLPFSNSLPAAATGTAPRLTARRICVLLGDALRRRAVAHVDHGGARASTRAAIARAESAHVIRCPSGSGTLSARAPGQMPSMPTPLAGAAATVRGGGAVEVAQRGAAGGRDVRAGDLRVADVDHRVDQRRAAGCRARRRAATWSPTDEVAPARAGPTAGRAPAPGRCGRAGSARRSRAGREPPARRRARARGRAATSQRAARRSAARRAARASAPAAGAHADDPGRRSACDRGRARVAGQRTGGAVGAFASTAPSAVGWPRQARPGRRAPPAGSEPSRPLARACASAQRRLGARGRTSAGAGR